MCGLTGFVDLEKELPTLQKMLAELSYRGPDDCGTYLRQINDKFIHLGQNRLSIQDTSKKGHQPFISECQNYILVFNGEVYNFKDIRVELEIHGQTFISNSDSEVVLYAYKHWGEGCLEKFIGMFAFAILDVTKEEIFIARDRAGVKPLYFFKNEKSFVFASELKSFHKHAGFEKKINKRILSHYFQLGYIPAPHTIFQNVYKLEAGHYMVYSISRNEYQKVKYWDVADHYKADKWDKTEDQILADLEPLLKDAVQLRMISDVPVGVFLSGGFDSSLVTALVQEKDNAINTFTIGFNEKEFNEAEHAAKVAKHFETNHTELYLDPSTMLKKIEDLPYFFDEPFGDSSSLATIQVANLAKKNVTVGLSADGGDEVFCGYSKYFALMKYNNYRKSIFKRSFLKLVLKILNKNILKALMFFVPKNKKITNINEKREKLLRAISSNSEEEMFLNASSYSNPVDVSKILQKSIKLNEHFKFEADVGFLDNMMLKDYKTFMVDDVLTKVDRSTMSVSLEGREPLLDHRIIEYMARVPEEIKYKKKEGKYLLRKILYKYIPKHTIDKPKAGFQIPLAKWLQKDLSKKVNEFINIKQLDKEIFNIKEVIRVRDSFMNGNDEKASLIWFILMFQMWREKWYK